MTQDIDKMDPVTSPPSTETVHQSERSHPDRRQKKQFEAALKKKLEEEKKKHEERLRKDRVEIGGHEEEQPQRQASDRDDRQPSRGKEAPAQDVDPEGDQSGIDIKA
jgi:hypothetical protein